MHDDTSALRAEVARLHKVVRALMERAERSTDVQGSEFSLFQTSIVLGSQVQARTAELEAALHENERLYRNLCESEARYHALVDQSLVGIAIIEGGRFSYVNPRFEEMFGRSAQELAEMGPQDLTAKEDLPVVTEQLRLRTDGQVDRVHYQMRGRRQNGETIDIEVHGNTIELAGRRALLSVVNDVTERCRAERAVQALQATLREQSLHDPLTGLYNRRYLDEALGRELSLAGQQQRPLSVVMGDLDHFKHVNDAHGHQAGDAVLKAFAQRLHHSARGTDTGCRLGGEEFLLVLPGIAKAGAVAVAERLRQATAATPTEFHGSSIETTASFGVATCPDDAQSVDQLIAAADQALYQAKRAGRNKVVAADA